MTKDVVCGMQVDEKTAQSKSNYMGTMYMFCSLDCKSKFDQKPETYARRTVLASHEK